MSEKTVSTRRRRKSKKSVAPEVEAAMPETAKETEGIVVSSVSCAPTPATERVPFSVRIANFNDMYGAESNEYPTNLGAERVENFHDILAEELTEHKEIVTRLKTAQKFKDGGQDPQSKAAELAALTDLMDWLTDIQVYCASEMRRWGLPIELGQDIVMDSNASKLGAGGKPIKDERGKILKGPDYWKPEPKMEKELRILIAQGEANGKK